MGAAPVRLRRNAYGTGPQLLKGDPLIYSSYCTLHRNGAPVQVRTQSVDIVTPDADQHGQPAGSRAIVNQSVYLFDESPEEILKLCNEAEMKIYEELAARSTARATEMVDGLSTAGKNRKKG